MCFEPKSVIILCNLWLYVSNQIWREQLTLTNTGFANNCLVIKTFCDYIPHQKTSCIIFAAQTF
jgi:hypothetical protein